MIRLSLIAILVSGVLAGQTAGAAMPVDSGRIFFYNKNYSSAASWYRQQLTTSMDSISVHRKYQDALFALGDNGRKTALAYYRSLNRKNPESPLYNYLLGRCVECREGARYFEKALKIRSCDAWAQNALGACYYEKGDTAAARKAFLKAIQCNFDFDEAYQNLAMMYAARGQYGSSKRVYRSLIDRKRDNGQAYEWLGNMYLDQKQYRYARMAYAKAIEYGETDPGIFFKAGYSCFEEKAYVEAMEYYLKSIKAGNRTYEVYYNLASVQELLNLPEQAIDNYEAALAVNGNDSIRYSIGNCAVLLGFYTKAIESYRVFLEKNPNSLEALFGLANSYQMKKDFTTAVDLYNKILSMDSTYTKAYYNLGSIYAYHIKDLKKMNMYWNRFLILAPDSQDAAFLRGEMKKMALGN